MKIRWTTQRNTLSNQGENESLNTISEQFLKIFWQHLVERVKMVTQYLVFLCDTHTLFPEISSAKISPYFVWISSFERMGRIFLIIKNSYMSMIFWLLILLLPLVYLLFFGWFIKDEMYFIGWYVTTLLPIWLFFIIGWIIQLLINKFLLNKNQKK